MPSGELRKLASDHGLKEADLLQHLSFTFSVEGISRACSHQLVRHRLASFSQKSQRYVEVRRLEEHVVVPRAVEERATKPFGEFIGALDWFYDRMIESGVPKEVARFILPNVTETSLLVTMDGRALLHFFGLRCCNRAQWEIRTVADGMLTAVRALEPDIFMGAGPYCFQLGYCPEGRFTCGRMKEVAEKYRSPNEG